MYATTHDLSLMKENLRPLREGTTVLTYASKLSSNTSTRELQQRKEAWYQLSYRTISSASVYAHTPMLLSRACTGSPRRPTSSCLIVAARCVCLSQYHGRNARGTYLKPINIINLKAV